LRADLGEDRSDRAVEARDPSHREHFRVHLDCSFKGLFVSQPVVGRVSLPPTIRVPKRPWL
jgi:hypothetical protein